MGPSEDDKRDRVVAAALALFEERGYEGTTVVAIAERAGLARRTFFRYFADKREVLFTRTRLVEELWVAAAADAPAPAKPLEVVMTALQATAELFEPRRADAARRQSVLAANPELQERELMKLARLAQLTAAELRSNGVDESSATAAAELGALVLRMAYEQWTMAHDGRPLASVMVDVFDELRHLIGDTTSNRHA